MWKIEEKYEHERVRGSGQNLIIEKKFPIPVRGNWSAFKKETCTTPRYDTHTHDNDTHYLTCVWRIFFFSLRSYMSDTRVCCVCVCVCVMATQTNHMNWIDGNDIRWWPIFCMCKRLATASHFLYKHICTHVHLFICIYLNFIFHFCTMISNHIKFANVDVEKYLKKNTFNERRMISYPEMVNAFFLTMNFFKNCCTKLFDYVCVLYTVLYSGKTNDRASQLTDISEYVGHNNFYIIIQYKTHAI